MNKVLNRPMFRQEALRKGHLKPVHAQIGVMVGGPTTAPQVPAVIPGEGVFSPVNLQKFGPPKPTFMQNVMRSAPARFASGIVNVPAYVGFEGTGFLADALGMKDSPYKMPLQLAGAYGATKLPGAAALGTIGFLPSAVGIGTLLTIADRTKAGIELRKKINAMSPEEREDFMRQNRLKSTDVFSEGVTDQELFGKFVPKAPEPIKPKTAAKPGEPVPGAGQRPGRQVLKAEGDELLNDKFESADGTANLTKIQDNSIAPVPPENFVQAADKREDASVVKGPPTTPETTPEETEPEVKPKDTNPILKGGASNDAEFNKTIALAKRYYNEVYQNKGTQANLVFLANLASGLLSGTTTRAGIGGALEVFGQALGPAVNNYATIKLKEGELRQNAREASLNAALEHMKFLNESQRIENPDIEKYGIVQVRGVDGRLMNFRGVTFKNGTIGLPAGLDKSGVEQFTSVPQGGPITDSGPDGIPGNADDRVIGNLENFLEQKLISNKLLEIHDVLGNRYNALSVARDVLRTLNQMDASGEKPKAGAALVVDSFIRRLTGVTKELALGNVTDEDIATLSTDALRSKLEEYEAAEKKAIEDSDLSEAEKKKALELVDRNRLVKLAKDKLKKRGLFSGLSRAEQERLAVQETTLVYALANTFKDQDRLTQRDIDAARNIVNIFSLTRSSADVRASIQAIAQQLEADIKRQEELYALSGGLETSVQQLRSLKNFTPFREVEGGVAEQLFKDLTDEEVKKELEGVQL